MPKKAIVKTRPKLSSVQQVAGMTGLLLVASAVIAFILTAVMVVR